MVATVLDGFISIMDKKLHGRVFKRLDGSFDEVVETGVMSALSISDRQMSCLLPRYPKCHFALMFS